MRVFKWVIALNWGSIIILGIFYLLMARQGGLLQKKQQEKTDQLQSAKEAQKKFDGAEMELAKIKQEAMDIYERVSLSETKPLALVKTLTLLGVEAGLEKIEFVFEENKNDGQSAGTVSAAPERMDLKSGGLPQGSTGQSPGASPEFTPLFIRMKFEAPYPQALLFLEKVLALKRIVVIAEIQINRVEKIFPRQQVTLKLIAYTLMPKP